MTTTVSNLEICFIKAVLLLCEHGHFLLNFASHGIKSPPAPSNTMRVNRWMNFGYSIYIYIYWFTSHIFKIWLGSLVEEFLKILYFSITYSLSMASLLCVPPGEGRRCYTLAVLFFKNSSSMNLFVHQSLTHSLSNAFLH